MTVQEVDQLFRQHSRLEGKAAENLKNWLGDGGAARRYMDLIPKPLVGEGKFVEIGCYQPSVGYYWHLGWKSVTGFYKDDGEGTLETQYQDGLGNQAVLIKQDVEMAPLPLPHNHADVVVMMEVVEHFSTDPMRALWEVNRVLKSGGRFVLSTPNAASWQHAVRALRGRAPIAGLEYTGYSTNRHNRLYDIVELREILAHAGFQVTSSFSVNYAELQLDRTGRLFKWLVAMCDRLTRFRSGVQPEREHFLVLKSIKIGPPRERYPSGLYFDPQKWPGIIEQRQLHAARAQRGDDGDSHRAV